MNFFKFTFNIVNFCCWFTFGMVLITLLNVLSTKDITDSPNHYCNVFLAPELCK